MEIFNKPSSRREMVKKVAATSFALLAGNELLAKVSGAQLTGNNPLKGKVNHSVCRWCYNSLSIDELCKAAKEMGITGIDLVGPSDWATVKKHGLTVALAEGAGKGIGQGFNHTQYHDELVKSYEDIIPKVAEAGFSQIICFSGNRNGLDDEQGIRNCVAGLKRLMPIAEKYKVTVVMELLNSKVDHADYHCDHTKWGVSVCDGVGSEYFKLLYDIYHMQIMEGNVIDTIKKYHTYFSHYHTGGVPGRNEIDTTQELYYPAIMKAILDTGFKGYVAQEFVPKQKDILASLKQGIEICDV